MHQDTVLVLIHNIHLMISIIELMQKYILYTVQLTAKTTSAHMC